MSDDPLLPNSFYLQSNLPSNGTPPNVLNVSNDEINPGNNVIGWVPPNCDQNKPFFPAL